MKFIELIVRRILFSFAVAVFVTVNFNGDITSVMAIAPITWVVTFLLFILSWRIEKEFIQLFLKKDTDDSSIWGEFEKKYPRVSAFIWQMVVTLGAIHVLYLALDLLRIIEVNGQRVELFLYAILATIVFRLIDQHTYRKK
jgi:hypothetical protein